MTFNSYLSILSFLTIIPISRSNNFDLNIIARNMHFFPLCGGIIGLIVGSISYFTYIFLPNYLSSFIVLITFIVITGIHHTDALADFADGLMAKGDKEFKHKVMSDPRLGSAGATALIIYFIGLFFALLSFNSPLELFFGILASEIIAKYIMVLEAGLGKPAWSGLSSPFTIEMKKRKKILFSTIITIVLLLITEGLLGFVSLGIVIFIGFIIYFLSCKNFGGVNGDVFGASNEIARLSSLFVLSTLTIQS